MTTSVRFLLIFGLGTVVVGAHAQGVPGNPVFDVASVKFVPTVGPASIVRKIQTNPGMLSGAAVLKQFIVDAYSIQDVLIAGGPEWLDSEVYDITARTEAQSTPAQLKPMLRSLLAERFQLKVHEETRETSYYAFVAGKNSPKLDKPRPEDRSSFDSRTGTVHFPDLASLARRMAGVAHPPVFDLTRAEGSVTIHPENVFSAGVTSVAALREAYFESLKGAIEREIGLKIEARKGPLKVVVIDSAVRPAEN